MKTEEILNEREKTHGDFGAVSLGWRSMTSTIYERSSECNVEFNPSQSVAIEMILLKLARIACGDPNFADHWDDIAGYAMLGKGKGKVTETIRPEWHRLDECLPDLNKKVILKWSYVNSLDKDHYNSAVMKYNLNDEKLHYSYQFIFDEKIPDIHGGVIIAGWKYQEEKTQNSAGSATINEPKFHCFLCKAELRYAGFAALKLCDSCVARELEKWEKESAEENSTCSILELVGDEEELEYDQTCDCSCECNACQSCAYL